MINGDNASSVLVQTDLKDGYAIITMNRPEKRNALNRAARRGLLEAFERAEAAGARVVILTGTDKSFCSGIDIVERQNDEANGVASDPGSDWIEIVMAIRQHPAIFIAAVNGGAMGGGAALISVSDLALASEVAWISNPEMGFGAFPHFSGPATQYQLQPKRAAWLIYTTERIDGHTAEAWGLINECVATDELLPRAEALAAKIAAFDPIALTESKRALDATLGLERDWRSAFKQGIEVNTRIRGRSPKSQLTSAVARMTKENT